MFDWPILISIIIAVLLLVNLKFHHRRLFIVTLCVIYGLFILEVLLLMDASVRSAITAEMQKGEVSTAFIEGVNAHNKRLWPEKLTILALTSGIAILAILGLRKNNKNQ